MSARVHEVGDGYFRLRMESPSQLVVNAWLLRNAGQAVLFDTGFPFSTDQLIEALADCDLRLEDLDAVVYTHTHNDHIGGGIALDDRLQAPNYIWEHTHPRLLNDFYDVTLEVPVVDRWLADFLPKNARNQAILDEMASIPEGNIRATDGPGALSRLRTVGIGEQVTLAGRTFEVVDARGHDPYHIAWLDVETRTLVGGDVILRVPTPIMPQMHDNLLQWLETITRWEQTLDVTRLLPGHGMPTSMFVNAIQRSRLVIERLYRATDELLEEGLPVDPVDIVLRYAGEDRSRYAQRHAVAISTTCALLIELERSGFIQRLDDGMWIQIRSFPEWSNHYPHW